MSVSTNFVLVDRALRERYTARFAPIRPAGARGRAADPMAPRLVAAPTSTLVVNLLTASLAGSVLLNVFEQELPDGRSSHFGWFLTGVAAYAIILSAVTAAAE